MHPPEVSGPETGYGEGMPSMWISVSSTCDGKQKKRETDVPATYKGSRDISISVFQLRTLPRLRHRGVDDVRGAARRILQ